MTIQTTHVGSLPRSKAVTDLVFAAKRREPGDAPEFDRVVGAAVDDIVARQTAAGIDLVSDGEMSKISYATYIKDSKTGFDGDSPCTPPDDLEDFPGFLKRQASSGGTPTTAARNVLGRSTPRRSRRWRPISRTWRCRWRGTPLRAAS